MLTGVSLDRYRGMMVSAGQLYREGKILQAIRMYRRAQAYIGMFPLQYRRAAAPRFIIAHIKSLVAHA